MADGTKANVDLSSVMQGLSKIGSPEARESIARRMAVAGGRVFRDEAKLQAPVDSGRLRDSLYVAFRDRESSAGLAKYRVAWNTKVAPHGHLVEFGHWQPYHVIRLPDGTWFTDVSRPRAQPKWTAAKPFMRPAWHTGQRFASEAMMEAGREAVADLLREQYTPPDGDFV